MDYVVSFGLFCYAKLVNGLLLILLLGAEYYRREVWAVWSVGEVLTFKTYSRALGEGCAMLSNFSGAEVGCIKLHTRFGGIDLESTSALWLGHSCREAQFAFLSLVEHVVVVVARTVLYLLVVGVNLQSECLWLAEVEWSAFHLKYFACRDAGSVDRQVEVGIDFAYLVLDGGSLVGDA